MTEPLVGRIVYRLHLAKAKDSHETQNKKRKRCESSSALATQPPDPPQAVAEAKATPEVALPEAYPIAAWIFQPDDHPEHEFVLSVPRCLLALTCDAARLHQTVEIRRYSKIPLLVPASVSLNVAVAPRLDEHETHGQEKQPELPIGQLELPVPMGRSISMPTTLVEVFRDGMQLLPFENTTLAKKSTDIDTDIWTLAQLARRERADQLEQISSRNQLYSFCATVHAISPVIGMDPADPFGLLELYDPESTYTCVVVLRKTGCKCQAAISTGDKLVFQNVQRQKWRIPVVLLANKKLAHLQGRIPSHVFVVNDEHQVAWEQPQSSSQSHPQPSSSGADAHAHEHSPVALPASPSSTPLSLCSLEGYITRVHKIRAGDETHIHYLEVVSPITNENENKNYDGSCSQAPTQQHRHCLYVTYFPMSTSLQLSLRPGAWIQADNIHQVGRTGWGPEDGWIFAACFRSSVVILKTASESVAVQDLNLQGNSLGGVVSNSNGTVGRSDAILSLDSVIPFPFLRVRRSYPEYACRQLLSTWMEDFRVPLAEKTNLPSLQDLSQALMGTKSRKTASRNAYAEFFDHGIDHDQVANNGQEEGGACHMSFHDRHGSLLPRLVCLGQLREACYDVLKARLQKYLMSSDSEKVQVGWTGSVTLSNNHLGQSMDRNCGLRQDGSDGSQRSPMFIGGMTGRSHHSGSLQAQLSNGSVVLPVVSTNRTPSSNSADMGFCFAKLSCVSISCICIGILSNETMDESSEVRMSQLPLYQCAGYEKTSEMGPCAIVEVGGRLFMASLSVNCDSFLPTKQHESTENQDTDRCSISNHRNIDDSHSSVQSCLDPSSATSSKFVVGLLTRTGFKLAKAKSGVYSGCMLTVSHDPFDGPDTPSPETVTCIQSIELKPSIKVEESKRQHLRRYFTNLLGTGVTDDQLTLALVWWKLGSNERTCALLGGGWDQLAPDGSLVARSVGVMVQIPRTSVQHDTKRGYVRFRCRVDDISASLQLIPGESRSSTSIRTPRAFDFVSSGRILPGMLDFRPRRITCHGKDDSEARKRGALLFSPRNPGIPTCTLASLSWAICLDLKSSSRTMLAPSLVREVRGARLMGISYCRAQACCTKCYKTLYEVKVTRDHNNSKKTCRNGVVASVSVVDSGHQTTFWDRPLPMSYTGIQNKDLEPNKPIPPPKVSLTWTQRKRSQLSTPLRCPENCSVEHHASIKWECSGTLDDGTGQAKLYADRDAVLALLGMDTATVEAIEAGAWLDENGIVFSKTMPPKPHIREAVVTAKAMACNEAHGRRGQRLQDGDALKFLTPLTRAEYLMQHFCRTSKHATRALNYYVRCKPLSDKTSFLSHTKVEIAAPGARGTALTRDVATFSLPPLKLNLVDCRVVPSDVHQSWDGLLLKNQSSQEVYIHNYT